MVDSRAIDEFCSDVVSDAAALGALGKQRIEAQCTGMDGTMCRKCVTYQCEKYGKQLVPIEDLHKPEWCKLMRYPVEFRPLHDVEYNLVMEKEGFYKGV